MWIICQVPTHDMSKSQACYTKFWFDDGLQFYVPFNII